MYAWVLVYMFACEYLYVYIYTHTLHIYIYIILDVYFCACSLCGKNTCLFIYLLRVYLYQSVNTFLCSKIYVLARLREKNGWKPAHAHSCVSPYWFLDECAFNGGRAYWHESNLLRYHFEQALCLVNSLMTAYSSPIDTEPQSAIFLLHFGSARII